MSRITVAQVSARVDTLVEAVAAQTELLSKVVAQMSAHSTPAPVVDLAERKAAKASKPATRKGAKASKAAPKAADVEVLTIAQAQERYLAALDEGEVADARKLAWKLNVRSTSGNVIPFGLVLRATSAQERASKPATKASTKKASKAGKAANAYFKMTGAQLVADGSKGAQAEIDRRAAKKAAKTA